NAVARHDTLLRTAVEGRGGCVFKTVGDGFYVAFEIARSALEAAVEAKGALSAELGNAPYPIRVRVGLHTGQVQARKDDYSGPALNRLARLVAIAHGGQVLASRATRELVEDDLPPGVLLRDLGVH